MAISENTKFSRVGNAVAAGTTTITSASVDTQGLAGVSFVVAVGAITAGGVQSAKLQGSFDDSAWVDLEGTSLVIADNDDNQLFVLDLLNSQHRYVRCTVLRATQNSAIDGIVALQYSADKEPVAQPVGTTTKFVHAVPAGTA